MLISIAIFQSFPVVLFFWRKTKEYHGSKFHGVLIAGQRKSIEVIRNNVRLFASKKIKCAKEICNVANWDRYTYKLEEKLTAWKTNGLMAVLFFFLSVLSSEYLAEVFSISDYTGGLPEILSDCARKYTAWVNIYLKCSALTVTATDHRKYSLIARKSINCLCQMNIHRKY